jgi:Holliday junction DNA helicase RuvA
MIRSIRGTVTERTLGVIVIETGGIGYGVHVALNAAIDTDVGGELALYTYHAVRENSTELFGFPTADDRMMFEYLLDLPGIGPKTALATMSRADTALLRDAALRGDASYLSKLSGIGKKSAEKIVAGLAEKFDADEHSASDGAENNDVIDALITLGYSEREVRDVIQKLPPETEGTAERLKAALKILGS